MKKEDKPALNPIAIEIPEYTHRLLRYPKRASGSLGLNPIIPVEVNYNNARSTVEYSMGESRIGLSNRVKFQVVDKESGVVVDERDWKPNLILDAALDDLGTNRNMPGLFAWCAAGTGSTPFEEDSGVTTGTTSGTTMTISGGAFSFVGTHAGWLVRFDTGETSKIASFGSGSSVVLEDALGIGAGTLFTIYDVERVSLTAEVDSRTNTLLFNLPNTGSAKVGNDLEMYKTFDFDSPPSTRNYNEVAFAPSNAGNVSMVALIAGGITVTTSQQLRVIYTFVASFGGPFTPVSVDMPITGWPVLPSTSKFADEQLCHISHAAVHPTINTAVDADTVTDFNGDSDEMDPLKTVGAEVFLSPLATAKNAFNASQPSRGTNASKQVPVVASYTGGSFERSQTALYSPSDGNRADWRTLAIGSSDGGQPWDPTRQVRVFVFDEPQTKDSSHSLSLTFKTTWARVFA